MKLFFLTLFIVSCSIINAQEKSDTTFVPKSTYKKKVLDNVEVNFLFSNYVQHGNHAAVTGGVGDEKLTDNTPTILVNIPLNDDDVLSVDFGVDVTTSASTNQINPFPASKATAAKSSWVTKSGIASGSSSGIITTRASGGGGVIVGGVLIPSAGNPNHKRTHGVIGYNSTSDNRSFTWGADGSFSTEKGYKSMGFGFQLRKSFNDDNSEFNLNSKAYLDHINPIYPGEFRVSEGLSPSVGFKLLDVTYRNSFSSALSFSQILNKRMQFSLNADIIYQQGLLSSNYQRVYFKDKPIVTYNGIELAHDIERLPSTRIKHPIGLRFNYFVSDFLILRTFYRHYTDNWGVNANTYDIQVPLKFSPSVTFYPMFRYHSQQQAKYFAPKSQHLSTELFYTSDYDLSTFNSSQYGFGLTIAPPLGIFKFESSDEGDPVRFKSVDLRYNYYNRTDGLTAGIITFDTEFTF